MSTLRRLKRQFIPAMLAVGARGKPVILRVAARAMREAGHVFFVTPNGVWLPDAVPSSFISGWADE